MRALLDVNVLIALLDQAHVHHQRARDWLIANIQHGWASCPTTQNGCVRIMSQPGYPQPVSTVQAMALLRDAAVTPYHQFWADDFSMLDDARIDSTRVLGPRQLTDLYLLALAVRHGGRFVTLDGRIALAAVRGATPQHLVAL